VDEMLDGSMENVENDSSVFILHSIFDRYPARLYRAAHIAVHSDAANK
jgi:hypothetical protein